MKPWNDSKDQQQWWYRYGVIMALVFEMIFFVLAGGFFGNFLDKKLGTHPMLLTSGGIFGLVAGIYRLVKIFR